MKLQNKSALITGAGSGIGRAIAQEFAHEGAKVAIADIDLEAATKAAGEIQSNSRFPRLFSNKHINRPINCCKSRPFYAVKGRERFLN
jgi:NAD(P)-dependent dehydrogenase (short-subunit alcohol dehydrogenase family)